MICMTIHASVLLTPVQCLMHSLSIYCRVEVVEGSECTLIPDLRLKGREGEEEQLGRDEEMSAGRVRGFMGEGGGVGKNRD